MFRFPSRKDFDSLTTAANAIRPTTALGFARELPNGPVAVQYTYGYGIGEFVLAAEGLPDVLIPASDGAKLADKAALESQRSRAAEAFLLDNLTDRVVSVRLQDVAAPTRFWAALATADPLSANERRGFDELAADAARVLAKKPRQDQLLAELLRLEEAADLIPALLHVLDVREVIARFSTTAKRALRHDRLLLNLFTDDLRHFIVYAQSDQGPGQGTLRPSLYPPSTIEAWTFSIVDDHTRHPMEKEQPSTQRGVRSSLRFPIRFDGKVIGGVAFLSNQVHAFTDADVPIGQRMSDYVASALSHFKLAERLAEQAQQAEQLRARTTNLELLDEMLRALTDAAGVQDTFGRMSAIAQKVLPHDALALPVFLPGGKTARRYGAIGLDMRRPEIIDIPEVFHDPAWEHDLIDDVRGLPGVHNERVASFGFLSCLRVPVRLDGKNVAVLVVLSRTRAAFKESDILVARRIADRLAVAMARDSTLEAYQRADEATERAARLEARVQSLTQELDARTGFRRVVGECPAWKEVLKQATQVAATETTALLLGESGTGKEVIARFLHRASKRSHGPFIALNCAALPEQLLEAELFGYERGAFTGATQSKPGQLEQAAGGTLLLDEVGEMSLPAQAKFLRVLQEREFQRLGGTRVLRTDARIVAATNRDLQKAIANNLFREDLYYRLNVFAIHLPPLRERRDDILPLTQAFLTEFGKAFANPPAGLSREARARLLAYDWPGNIRELRNILERAAILCDGGLITDAHLALPAADVRRPELPASAEASAVREVGREGDLQSIERAVIEQALQNARFNKSKAAKALGLTRHQLYIRMRRHGLAQ